MDPSVFRVLQTASSAVRGAREDLHDMPLLAGMAGDDLQPVDGRPTARCFKVRQGETLFSAGDVLDLVYEIGAGFFKTVMGSPLGVEQVMGFHTAGEFVGLDAVAAGRHGLDAVALEDSRVWALPYAELVARCDELPSLNVRFHRRMSSQIAQAHAAMLRLGSMTAPERVVAFLLDLTQRLGARGYSSTCVQLRMSRGEIGSYLGLKLETVSRTLSSLQAAGLLHVQHREITLTDPARMRRLMGGDS